jgi:hypothetical protein
MKYQKLQILLVVDVLWRWLLVCKMLHLHLFCYPVRVWFDGVEINVLSGIYDERSIRSHLRRVRELLSLSSLHVSLSTSLALQQESAQEKSAGKVSCQFYHSRSVGLLINCLQCF